MSVASASPERIQAPQSPIMEPSPSRFSTAGPASEAEGSSSPVLSYSADTPDHSETCNSSSTVDPQSAASLKSEEYRQLFRLPPDEALIEDFNCAFQENILIQGHMYLFIHYICFYSNIFGYETKKIIPLQEVTSVKRAKTAGIFPNAIEIFAGAKKYFFASFLSRDEAFRIINDGWAQYVDGGKANTEQQDSISETGSQENGVVIESVESSKCLVNELDSTDRNEDAYISQDSKPASNDGDDSVLTSLPGPQDIAEGDLEPSLNGDPSCLKDSLIWKEESYDAPNIPECYTKVAESQFPIKVEDFFNLFFSDDVFTESFHRSCGDKELKCTPWHLHETFGHTRDVSFQHPIKLYFGAKFGSCQELQKFRVHRNRFLIYCLLCHFKMFLELVSINYDYYCQEGSSRISHPIIRLDGCMRVRNFVLLRPVVHCTICKRKKNMFLAMASSAPTIRLTSRSLTFSLFFLLPLLISTLCSNANANGDAGSAASICIVGGGIGGSSVAHFLRRYSPPNLDFTIRIFERNGVVGGRMATVNVSGQTFEAGASILHPRNLHALNYTKLLNLTISTPPDSESSSGFAIWDGHKFVFKTLSFKSKLPFAQKIVSLANSLIMLLRYGFSLVRMERFVESAVNNFCKYYEGFETRPVFETVDEMLQWAGLYNLTTRTLAMELADAGLSPLLIQELVTVITRINYGQSVDMSGLAGAVSLAGSGGRLWSIKGGNWQMAAGLIDRSEVELHLHEEIESISSKGEYYELNSTQRNSYTCDVAVVATPLDESSVQFTPPISIPKRELQHTHATFVRGLLNPVYFGLNSGAEIPELVGTIEDPDLPFSSISVLKQHNENDFTYKIFSRKPMADATLDSIFSVRTETIRINWAAYPHYTAPEVFAPFILDGQHLYYVNAFENAASTMETSAAAAENVARLILSRFFTSGPISLANLSSSSDGGVRHVDL